MDWKVAFDVATRWARRNLPRLSGDVVEHAEALVAATMGPERDPGRGKTQDPPDIDPQEGQQVPQGRWRQRQDETFLSKVIH